jgi:hypothetical protein
VTEIIKEQDIELKEMMFNPEMLEQAARASYNYLNHGSNGETNPGAVPWEKVPEGNKAVFKVSIAVALNAFYEWTRNQIFVPVPEDVRKVVKTGKDGKEISLH